MLTALTDLRTYVVLFLLFVLVWFALPSLHPAPVMQAQSIHRFWSISDYDGKGIYPNQDCGRNYFLQMRMPGQQQPCTVRSQDADPINRQAMGEMQADGADLFRTPEDLLDAFNEYVAQVLERIAPSW